MTIRTTFVHPPVTCRDWDWQATFDGYEPGDPIGRGATEQAAIDDLKAQLMEDYAALSLLLSKDTE